MLRCWREIANRHVVDHPTTQRVILAITGSAVGWLGGNNHNPLRQEILQSLPPFLPR
jgi:hypothetical protein